MKDYKVVLASSSPRRRELLHKILDDFCIMSPICEEISKGNPQDIVVTNAQRKADACKNGDIIIACDTIVCKNGKVFGKPNSVQDAICMIQQLNGKWHSVYSGVCVIALGREITFWQQSKVKFAQLSTKDIEDYVKEYMPLDKAGSYGIQDGKIVERYDGELDNIIGLPTQQLTKVLREFCNVKESNF